MKYIQTTNWNNSLPILILLLLTSISFSDTVSGKVTDLSGNPISNVNIYSGNTGTNSDENGDFQIDVNNETLLTLKWKKNAWILSLDNGHRLDQKGWCKQ